jgi:hypothetical protein
MPDNNPLIGLKKATGIGQDPMYPSDPSQLMTEDSLAPPIGGGGLLGWAGGKLMKGLGFMGEVGPEAIAGLQKAIPSPLSSDVISNLASKAEQLAGRAGPTFDQMEAAGAFAGDRTAGGIARNFQAPVRKAYETLGEIDPTFTPVGGEDYYNMGRSTPKTSTSGLDDFIATFRGRKP